MGRRVSSVMNVLLEQRLTETTRKLIPFARVVDKIESRQRFKLNLEFSSLHSLMTDERLLSQGTGTSGFRNTHRYSVFLSEVYCKYN